MKKAKETQNAAGKVSGMSGRDLFDYRPEWFEGEDDEDAEESEEGEGWDLDKMRRETQEEQERLEKEEEERVDHLRGEFEAVELET